MATLRNYTFEGGVDGVTITTSDAGSGDAWNIVNLPADGGIEYDTARAADGTLSGRLFTTVTAAQATLIWTYTEIAEVYSRFYLYLPSTGTVSNRLANFETATFVSVARAQIVDVGGPKLRMFWNNDAASATGSVPVDRDKWIRIETRTVVNTSTGLAEARLFNAADSTSPSEVVTSGAINTGSTNLGRVRFGWNNNLANAEYWFDVVTLDDAAFPGPVVPPESFPTRRSMVA